MISKVLYEDNHLIAVFKPAGMLVQADKTGDCCLMDEVKNYLKKMYHKSGNVFLGLIHRLDRPVSGIVLFAKTSKGAARLSEQFRSHTVVKQYTALVVGCPPKEEDSLVHYLEKNEHTNTVSVYNQETKNAQRAELAYRILEKRGETTVLSVILKTGRPHQIRAQLSYIGCPIVGDVKYGARTPLTDKSIALIAKQLSFTTATGSERKEITIPFTY